MPVIHVSPSTNRTKRKRRKMKRTSVAKQPDNVRLRKPKYETNFRFLLFVGSFLKVLEILFFQKKLEEARLQKEREEEAAKQKVTRIVRSLAFSKAE